MQGLHVSLSTEEVLWHEIKCSTSIDCCPLRTGMGKFGMIDLKTTGILRLLFFSNTDIPQFKTDVGINKYSCLFNSKMCLIKQYIYIKISASYHVMYQLITEHVL